MGIDVVFTGYITFFSFCLFFLSIKAWRLSLATWTRQKVFSARADLFDAAYRENAFNDPAYQQAENAMNGLLRLIDGMNGFSILYIWIQRHLSIEKDELNINNTPLAKDIDDTRNQIIKALLYYIRWGTPSGFAVLLFLQITGNINRFIRIAYIYSRKMAVDDFARKEKNQLRHAYFL